MLRFTNQTNVSVMKTKWLIVFLLLGLCSIQAQKQYFVNQSTGQDTHTGLSWEQALGTLQAALDKVQTNDEIRVAAGVYVPTQKVAETNALGEPLNNRNKTFLIPAGVKLLGGFSPHATSQNANERDTDLYETVLSGDLNGNDTGLFENTADNAYHVLVLLLNTADTTILDGLTITGGHATGNDQVYAHQTPICNYQGGGIYGNASAATLTNASPVLRNLKIRGNEAANEGGGLYLYAPSGEASPILSFSEVADNKAENGAGIFLEGKKAASPTLYATKLTGNEATQRGGGLYCLGEDGGGSPFIHNTLVAGNRAIDAAGLYLRSYAGDVAPTLTQVTISGNKAADDAGGMACIASVATSKPVLQNTVIWGNNASNDKSLYLRGSRTQPVLNHTYIEETQPANPEFVGAVAPEFAPTSQGNYRLSSNSPLINKGNNVYVHKSWTDLDGKPRTVDQLADIGAYEFQDKQTVSSQAVTEDDKQLWAFAGKLYVKANHPSVIRIYGTDGQLVKQENRIAMGTVIIPLVPGFYIVTINGDETVEKVFVPNP